MINSTVASPDQSIFSKRIRIAFIVFFLLCIGLNLYCSFIGFKNPIGFHHSFRRAQTAMSAFYTIIDGYKIAYETPVLGAPWSIPMEFPLYQWTMATWTILTGMPLEMSGRLVSLFFFYCCLPVIFLFGRSLGLSRTQALLPLCLTLLCPIYIYWSRTIMIESMALFFSLSFLFCFIRFRQQGNRWLLALAVACGILGGLVKITTLFVSSIPVILCGASDIFNVLREQHGNPNVLKRLASVTGKYALALGIPVVIAVVWTHYADSIKAQNPLAGFLLSSNLTTWNFGTFDFRFSKQLWKTYILYLKYTQIGPLLGLVVLVPLFITKSPIRIWGVIALCTYLAGPLVFSNLYFVHDYYSYANTIFLLFAMSCGLLTLQRLRWGEAASLVLLVMLGVFFGYCYTGSYAHEQSTPASVPPQLMLLKIVTHPNEILFINDQDWNPYGPYCAQRRAIMNKQHFGLNEPKLQKSIALTGLEKITAVSGKHLSADMFAFFKLFPKPIFSNIYLRRDVYKRAYKTLFHVDLDASGPPELLRVWYWQNQFSLAVAPGGAFALPVPASARSFTAQVILPQQKQMNSASYQGYCTDDSAAQQLVFERTFSQSAEPLTVALPEKNCQHLVIMRNPQDTTKLSFWTEMNFH